MRPVRRSLPILLVIAVLLQRALYAHAHLERAEPAQGSVVHAVPRAVRLWFSEAPVLAATRVQLVGPDSIAVPLSALRVIADRGVEADVGGALAAGQYVVIWQTAAADGHPSRGRIAFRVA